MMRDGQASSVSSAAPSYISWPLRCPHDRADLIQIRGSFECLSCRRRFSVEGDLVDFLETSDSFYEGAYLNEVRFLPRAHGWIFELPLWAGVNGYLWTVRRYISPGARIVELGCAGGIDWFGARYGMAGIDLSLASLRVAARKYQVGLRSSALALPLADGCADAVVSSYFWEHVAPADKPKVLAELSRVLRPGGRLVFVYDVATENPLIAALRGSDPSRYAAEFLENDGHVGYQSQAENERLFLGAGLRVIASRTLERTPLQSPSVYEKMRRWPGAAALVGRVLNVLNRPLLARPYILFLRVIDETVGRLFPGSWGRIALVVLEKP